MIRIVALCVMFAPLLVMAQTAETDEAAIRAVMDRFMGAWNRHDAKAFAAVFSEDADFTDWRGEFRDSEECRTLGNRRDSQS
jgi:hypothetical protein